MEYGALHSKKHNNLVSDGGRLNKYAHVKVLN